MIQANELRIGNWVSKNGISVRVEYYFLNDDHYGLLDGGIDYNPIPLTAEILAKCGAQWDGDDYYNLIDSSDEILINWSESGLRVDHIELPHIKYVHQLQNVYFALTGKELEVKL